MKTTFILFTFFLSVHLFSQEIDWVKKIPTPPNIQSKGLITDNDGNLFNYGSRYPAYYYWNESPLNDTIGSYLQKFSANGDLIFSVRWKKPFYIQKIIYDNASSFYFTGAFLGNQTINGITISSNGLTDAFVGKMDLNGNVVWLTSYGGRLEDEANGLCFNLQKNKLVVTGKLTDSLVVNGNYMTSGTKSMIIATYDLNGALQHYRLYDFDPSRSFQNSGQEIECDKEGNYLLLADRDGQHWSDWPLTSTPEGRYVFKLNANLDTLWSKFIISSGCYYGWSCKKLSVSHNGDAYIPSYCSSKYGGTGAIRRLDGKTGDLIWTANNKDGTYSDTYVESSTLYMVGTEGANHCPCQGSHSGYQVIKKVDKFNNVKGETRLVDVFITNITKNNQGKIFVMGYTSKEKTVIGKDTLYGLPWSPNYLTTTHFLIGLNDIDCISPSIDSLVMHPFPEYFCPSSSVLLDAGSGYSSYLWNNGATQQVINVNQPGSYMVAVTQASGCKAYSLPKMIIAKSNTVAPEICIATYDTATHKNRLAWRVSYEWWASKYLKIHKEISPGNIVVIDSLIYPEFDNQKYIDSLNDPGPYSGSYYLSCVDTCGNESPLSLAQRPVFLSLEKVNDNNELRWTPFIGFPFTKYYLYRGESPDKLMLWDSLSANSSKYTDFAVTKTYYYQVQVQKLYGCYIDNTVLRNSVSNIVPESIVADNRFLQEEFISKTEIYPNPSNGTINIHITNPNILGDLHVEARNTLGQTIYSKTFKSVNELTTSIELNKEAAGVYFIEISSGEQKEVRRIVLN